MSACLAANQPEWASCAHKLMTAQALGGLLSFAREPARLAVDVFDEDGL
jgi:hypothetical protein